MLKKFMLLIFALVILNLNFKSYGFEIPDKINEWHLVKEFSQPLIADVKSQDLGCVIYKKYERNSPVGTLQIILTEGKGTGNLYVPENVKNSKGVMPAGAGYKVIEISGKKAILENQSYMPLALAVNVDENIILTIESKALDENEIVNFAKEILSWNITKSD